MTKKIVLLFIFIINLQIESFVSLRIPHYINYDPENEINRKGEIDPLAPNLTQCAHRTKSSIREVELYIKRMSQKTVKGKCFIACMLKKVNIIKNNKVSAHEVIASYSMIHAEHSPFMAQLKATLRECIKASEAIPDVCELASVFSECFNARLGPTSEAWAKQALDSWDLKAVTKEEENLINYVKERLL